MRFVKSVGRQGHVSDDSEMVQQEPVARDQGALLADGQDCADFVAQVGLII